MNNIQLIDPDSKDMEMVINYLKNPQKSTDLGEKLKAMLERWKMTNQLLLQHGNRTRVANMLMKIYNYTVTTAYSDINTTEIIFGKLTRSQKEFWRNWAADLLRESITKAKEKEDHKSVAMLMKELRETLGYDKDESLLPDFSNVQLPEVEIGFFPELHEVPMPKDLDSHIANLALRKNNTAIEDIEHQIIAEPPTQGAETPQINKQDYDDEEEDAS